MSRGDLRSTDDMGADSINCGHDVPLRFELIITNHREQQRRNSFLRVEPVVQLRYSVRHAASLSFGRDFKIDSNASTRAATSPASIARNAMPAR